MAPQLARGRDATVLTWLEPIDPAERGAGFRLRLAELRGEAWSPPQEIVAGESFFANWADLPGSVEGIDGTRFAHYLRMLGPGTYAYGVRMAFSHDRGST